jgi:hypothetical protein
MHDAAVHEDVSPAELHMPSRVITLVATRRKVACSRPDEVNDYYELS